MDGYSRSRSRPWRRRGYSRSRDLSAGRHRSRSEPARTGGVAATALRGRASRPRSPASEEEGEDPRRSGRRRNRPETCARQGLPAWCQDVPRESEQRIHGRMAVGLLASEWPEPVQGLGTEQSSSRAKSVSGGRREPVRGHQVFGGRLPVPGELRGSRKRTQPGAEPLLSAQAVALIPNDDEWGRSRSSMRATGMTRSRTTGPTRAREPDPSIGATPSLVPGCIGRRYPPHDLSS